MEPLTSKADLIGIILASTEASVKQQAQLISDDDIIYIRIFYDLVMGCVISTLGVTSNILNIIVYWKQGIRDSVNITFIALSVWDLSICLFSGLSVICSVIDMYFPVPDVSLMSVQYLSIAYTRACVYVLSTLVTVYLSVERCICIKYPFKVKDIFTTPRVVLINMFIAIFGMACFSPAWATQGMHWEYDPMKNKTRLVLWVSSNRREIDVFVDTFSGMVLPAVAQFLITVCAVFMIQGLKKSAKFRNQVHDLETAAENSSKKESASTSTTLQSVKMSHTMTKKDLKLTKFITTLALIFFGCNLPVFIVALVRALVPDIDIGKLQHNLYIIIYGSVYVCGLINASVNIFVYYNVSTRYRQVFLGLGKFVINRN